MDDYINRREAIEAVDGNLGDWNAENWAVSILMRLPSAGVEPVVRCKDCEFYTEEERWCRRLGLCGAFDANGYCSHAERSEEWD